MSASREKKQLSSSEPVQEKVLTPEEREAAAKRKTKQYLIIGLVIAVLCAALLFWDSGIIQRNSVAVSIGDTDYTVAEATYYYNMIYQETATYSQYGMNGFMLDVAPEEQLYYADPMNDVIKSWADYFRETTVETLTNLTALYDAAIEAGYTEEDAAAEIEAEIATVELSAKTAGYASLKQMLAANYGKMMTPKNYRNIISRAVVANSYIENYGASLEFSAEDLDEYYADHKDEMDTVEYGYLYFRAESVEKTDADGKDLPAEEIEAAEAKALADAKALAEEAAEKLNAAPAAEREALLAQLIKDYELSATTSSSRKSLKGSSILESNAAFLLDESRKANDVTTADYAPYGTYVLVFYDRYLDETPSVNVHHILIKAESETTVPTDAEMADAKAKAEDILAQWKAGEATEESFAKLADELSEDGRDAEGNLNAPGGLYENVYEGNFVTNFNNWLFHEGEREVGETGIIENDGVSNYYGYHVVYFAGENEGDFAWKVTARDSLTSEQVTLYRDGLADAYTATEKSGMKYVG